jgi:hypothetical protein
MVRNKLSVRMKTMYEAQNYSPISLHVAGYDNIECVIPHSLFFEDRLASSCLYVYVFVVVSNNFWTNTVYVFL